MHSRLLVLGLGLIEAVLPGWAIAQAGREVRTPDGTVFQPLPVVQGLYPSGTTPEIQYSRTVPDINVFVTGSAGPRIIPAFPEPEAVDRPGCDVETYTVGPGNRVRIHRC